ncbi:unnamed protein product [Sphenostylis stenocarpa]|uniref:Cytochrome P450 n=1 Tax=Sphenostylis stenocarpa TaxID=92480 RepID=A0AA87BBW2_9FABA|nr:unnamed protein product [Sphenostylis stenocarpa]
MPALRFKDKLELLLLCPDEANKKLRCFQIEFNMKLELARLNYEEEFDSSCNESLVLIVKYYMSVPFAWEVACIKPFSGYCHHNIQNLITKLSRTVVATSEKGNKSSILNENVERLQQFGVQIQCLKLAEMVSEAAISNNIIEMQELFMKATIDSVCKVILGVELDTVYGTNKEGREFSNAFDEASAAIMYRYFNFLWRIMRFLNIGAEAVLRKSLRVMDEFFYKLIRNKIEQAQKLQENLPVMKGDMLSRFIELKETDPKYLRDISLSFILAGRDTTAITLSWFLSAGSTIDEFVAGVTEEENLEKMQYLHASLNETLRLHPEVSVQGKYCFSDDMWPDGFSVRKGDLVSFQPYVMGRMKFLWGEDAERFRPERWLDGNGILKKESPFKFPVFHVVTASK